MSREKTTPLTKTAFFSLCQITGPLPLGIRSDSVSKWATAKDPAPNTYRGSTAW